MPDLQPVRLSAAEQPLSVAMVKKQVGLLEADWDDLLEVYADSACEHVAAMTGLRLREEVWRWSFCQPGQDVALPLAPVRAVTALTYIDTSGAVQDLDVADVLLISDGERAFLRPKPGIRWPATAIRPDALTVTLTVGLDSMPTPLLVASMMLAAHWFKNREAVTDGAAQAETPLAVASLVEPFRLRWVAA